MGMTSNKFQNSIESRDGTSSDGKRTDASGNKAEGGPQTASSKSCYTQKSQIMIWKAKCKSDRKLGN